MEEVECLAGEHAIFLAAYKCHESHSLLELNSYTPELLIAGLVGEENFEAYVTCRRTPFSFCWCMRSS